MSLFDGMSRPLRAAGVVLLGIAVVAGIVGGITVLTGGDTKDNAAPPSSSAAPGPGGTPAPGPGEPTSPGSTTPAAPTSTTPPPAETNPASPPPGQPGQPSQPGTPGANAGTPAPGGPQDASKWVTVRVYNNSTIHGLAARAADDLRRQGWNVGEVSNYSAGVIPTTTAYFRPGTDEEAAARAMATEFGMRVEARFEGIQNSNPGVIVIVTNDYKGDRGGKG
jgi:hypothetical protein